MSEDATPSQAQDATAALVAALNNQSVFDHPVTDIRLIETHISWVILTGSYVYKIKKPVDFGFLDFSTLEKRRHNCAEELRLNRRYAPDIYLDLVEIRGSIEAPRLQGPGEIIEYAVKMREFPQSCLLSALAGEQRLGDDMIDDMAARVTAIHAASDSAPADSEYGSAESVWRWSNENMVHIANAIPTEWLPTSYFQLQRWYRENQALSTLINRRRHNGFVRECHGDLHLGNMALIDRQVRFFDCIEFNPELRWIDCISEAAFVAMDLEERGYPEYCWRFLNRYIESSGDYEGIEILRYYVVYRALVRAKVEALRVDQEYPPDELEPRHFATAFDYIELARRWALDHRAGLILMHGLSGSGKSTVAAGLAQKLGALQIRSDVVRKQLFGLDADADSESGLDSGIYSSQATEATYRRLREIASTVIAAGFTVIVDATFLQESRRREFLEIETNNHLPRLIINCDVPTQQLRERIIGREKDASEANLDVLERQMQTRQPIGLDELEVARMINVGQDGIDQDCIDEIAAVLSSLHIE